MKDLPSQPTYDELAAVYYCHGRDEGWFGYQSWPWRLFGRKSFLIFTEPHLIDSKDAEAIKSSVELFEPNATVEIWRLTKEGLS